MDAQLLTSIETELAAGESCMLATIIGRVGSVPRGIGAGMLISAAGEQTGTVGGGSLEFRARQDAMQLLINCDCAVKQYEIHSDEKAVYSGGVTILFRLFSGEAGLTLCTKMRDALETEREAYLICQITENCPHNTCVVSAEKLCALCNLDCAPEEPRVTDGTIKWMIEPLKLAPRVILFGGGHVAQCMARQLALLEYRIWVVEDREEFATKMLFPIAERVIHSEYDGAEVLLNIHKRDHAIVMSRGHETDYQILRWLLRTESDYIGCIGSKRKIALTKSRLLTNGLINTQIERLHAPIGLSIGAETPAEIAVSVAAELIQYCASGKSS